MFRLKGKVILLGQGEAVANLQDQIDQEVAARQDGDTDLQNQIDGITDQQCSQGEVVTGIAADGTLICTPLADIVPAECPCDFSLNLLTVVFAAPDSVCVDGEREGIAYTVLNADSIFSYAQMRVGDEANFCSLRLNQGDPVTHENMTEDEIIACRQSLLNAAGVLELRCEAP